MRFKEGDRVWFQNSEDPKLKGPGTIVNVDKDVLDVEFPYSVLLDHNPDGINVPWPTTEGELSSIGDAAQLLFSFMEETHEVQSG